MCARWKTCRLPPLGVFAETASLRFRRALIVIPVVLFAGPQMAQGQRANSYDSNANGPGTVVVQPATPTSGIVLVSRLSDGQAYAAGPGGVRSEEHTSD